MTIVDTTFNNNPTIKPTNTTGATTGGTTVVVKPVVTNKTAPIVSPVYTTTTVVQVQNETESGGNSTLMIAVICSIVGVILFGGAIGYFIYKKFARTSSPTMDQSMKAVEQSSKVGNSVAHGGSPDNMIGDEIYEEQYHPSGRVVDIFNMAGDPIKKMNEADDVIREESEAADDDDESSASPDHQDNAAAAGAQDSHTINMLTNVKDTHVHE